MVAPVDVSIYFCTRELFEEFADDLQARSSQGGGGVSVVLEAGEVAAVVDVARSRIGGTPLGLVVATEGDALEAIGAGADEAQVLTKGDAASITTFLDHTRVRAAARREGERQNENLAQAEKLTALGTLVAGVGHELNNPLSTVTLGFDVLRQLLLPDLARLWEVRNKIEDDGSISSDEATQLIRGLRANVNDVRALMNDLVTSTEVVSQLVQDLRVFSRNNVEERPSLFQPQQVIDQAMRLVRREFGPDIVIEQDYDDELPELFLERNRLAQVLTNLLVNAAHAMREVERKGHRLRISARRDEQHVALSISDTGPGIPEEALERIFDPFFTTKREGQGTGLGLSISRSIIVKMGGDLAVSSVYGDGATFLLFLPLPSEEDVEKAKLKRVPLTPLPDSKARRAVLLIEDDERVLRTISRCLRDKYRVLVARDGLEATELLDSGSQVDAIVMELDLPEMDGCEFYAWLVEHRSKLAKHVVVATAAQERGKYRAFLDSHNMPVLNKPLNAEGLLEALATVVQSKK